MLLLILSLVVLIGVPALVKANFKLQEKYEEKIWNNGKCPTCGEEWKYVSIKNGKKKFRCKNNHECEIIVADTPKCK